MLFRSTAVIVAMPTGTIRTSMAEYTAMVDTADITIRQTETDVFTGRKTK